MNINKNIHPEKLPLATGQSVKMVLNVFLYYIDRNDVEQSTEPVLPQKVKIQTHRYREALTHS